MTDALAAQPFSALVRQEAPLGRMRLTCLLGHPLGLYCRLLGRLIRAGWAMPEAGLGVRAGNPTPMRAPDRGRPALKGVGVCDRGASTRASDGRATNARFSSASRAPPGQPRRTNAGLIYGFCLFGSGHDRASAATAVMSLGNVRGPVSGEVWRPWSDFDVHHGKAAILGGAFSGIWALWDEPRALFVSSHQMPLFLPVHRRPASERGGSNNIPQHPGAGRGGSDGGACMRSLLC